MITKSYCWNNLASIESMTETGVYDSHTRVERLKYRGNNTRLK